MVSFLRPDWSACVVLCARASERLCVLEYLHNVCYWRYPIVYGWYIPHDLLLHAERTRSLWVNLSEWTQSPTQCNAYRNSNKRKKKLKNCCLIVVSTTIDRMPMYEIQLFSFTFTTVENVFFCANLGMFRLKYGGSNLCTILSAPATSFIIL